MKSFIDKFQDHFQSFGLPSDSQFLIAVSGGIDSMVLCNLFLELKVPFQIAHCNFQLRGNESDEDEAFVVQFAQAHQIPVHTKKFDVKAYKDSGNFSTQMAARNLRYHWFEELKSDLNFDYLVTAHHFNDSIETFFLNLSRGSGIEGLTGISPLTNYIFRPLLPFTKEEIKAYAKKNQLSWREDCSNASTDYHRNKIRHQIIPVLEEIHPEFFRNFNRTLENLKSEKEILIQQIHSIKAKAFIQNENQIRIDINFLQNLSPLSAYLHHLFHSYGFHHPYEIEKLMQSTQNGEIQSANYRLIKNRTEFLLIPRELEKNPTEIPLDIDQILEKPLYLRFSISKAAEAKATEVVDASRLKFPLKLRKPKQGDFFFPLGMNGSKKLSKFFKDEKYSKIEKEEAWLLVDAEENIVYVVGKRLDDRFKITDNTHKFLNIYLC